MCRCAAPMRSSATAPMADARPGRRHRRRGGGRPFGGRGAAGAQALARPWPRPRRQPCPAAGGERRPRGPGNPRFRGLPAAVAAAAGDDRACGFFCHRPGRAGHDFGHNGARSDSRLHRLPGTLDERRYCDGRAVGRGVGARARGARGRLRYRAPLQRQARRDAGGRRRMRRRSPARRRGARDAALAAAGTGGIRRGRGPQDLCVADRRRVAAMPAAEEYAKSPGGSALAARATEGRS